LYPGQPLELAVSTYELAGVLCNVHGFSILLQYAGVMVRPLWN